MSDFLEPIAAGVSREEILAEYGFLETGDITAALRYADPGKPTTPSCRREVLGDHQWPEEMARWLTGDGNGGWVEGMIRTQIYLTKEEHTARRHMAGRSGRSRSGVIRGALADFIARQDKAADLERLRSARGVWAGRAEGDLLAAVGR